MSVYPFFTQQLEQALGWMIVHTLWQAMFIALVIGILNILLRKQSAQVRYVIANLGLAALVLAAGITFCLYYQNPAMYEAINTWQATEPWAASAAPSEQSVQGPPIHETPTETRLSMLSALEESFSHNLPLIATLWFLGAMVFLLKMLSSISYIYYLKSRMNFPADGEWLDLLETLLKKSGIGKQVSLLESALVRTPQMLGFVKPAILFPLGMINRLPAEEVEAILAHELAHIARHDYFFNILQGMVETLFYYHPAVWWLSAVIRTERESAADEKAIQLTGDPFTYAKALVTVQEMGTFPLSPSLAFAGHRYKSQFLLRIQRILNIKSPKWSIMDKMITTILVASLLSGFFWFKNIAQPNDFENYFLPSAENKVATDGFWNAEIKGDKVYLRLQSKTDRSNWNISQFFDKNEFSALPSTESAFTMTRAAGTLHFTGKFEGAEGYGKFRFEESAEFQQYLSQQGITGIDGEDMLHLFIANTDRSYVDLLVQNGYQNIKSSNLVEMAIHGIDKETLQGYLTAFQKAGLEQVGLHKMVELKIHGADPEYMQSFAGLGYDNTDIDEILEAKIHGVSADYIRELQSAGYTHLPMERIVEFKIHGISPDFARRMTQANGGKNLATEELVAAKIHGLDPERIGKIQQSSGGNTSMEDMMNYNIHGVDDEFIQSLKDAGFVDLSPEQIVEAKIHGLEASYLKGIQEAGFTDISIQQAIEGKIHGLTGSRLKGYKEAYKDLPFKKAIEFNIHGVSVDFLKQFVEAGFSDISPNKIVEMKIHGVQPEEARAYKNIGLRDLSTNDLIEFKIHGLNPEFIKGFYDLGFTSVDKEELVQMKIHGVTPEYIKRMRDKGFKDLDLEDYLKMKIHGITEGRN